MKITVKDIEPLALGIAEWHKAQNTAGESTVVFRDSAFDDDGQDQPHGHPLPGTASRMCEASKLAAPLDNNPDRRSTI